MWQPPPTHTHTRTCRPPSRATLQQKQRECDGSLGGCQSHRNKQTRWSHAAPSCPVRPHYIWGESSRILLLSTVWLIPSLQWGCGAVIHTTKHKYKRKRLGYIKSGVLNDPNVSSNNGHEIVLSLRDVGWAVLTILSPDVAASEHIAEIFLSAEESWLQRQADPSTPLPCADQRYDGGSHDVNTPVKNLYVLSSVKFFLYLCQTCHKRCFTVFVLWHVVATSFYTPPPHLLPSRNPLGLPICKRDSLLEKCTMFREAGVGLSRHPSQDNGLDGPFGSGTSKVEQVPLFFSTFSTHTCLCFLQDS